MKLALGVLRWTPDTFWRSTFSEFFSAVNGYSEARGGKKPPQPPTDDEMQKLIAQYG